ncbi:MAG TPA: hypothetical protein VKP65_16340 [Rhodothermales bacterium]|nr:hypothetical protein [Rhodothermales bacterium]
MQILLDNLTATIMGGAILLMIITANISNRESLTDSTAFYTMIMKQEAFAYMLTRDLQSVERLSSIEEASDSTFRFRGHIGDDATLHTIVYKREYVRDYEGTAYYQIHRMVDGEIAGGSGDIITNWQVEARDVAGVKVSDTDAAKQIYVRFDVGSKIGKQAKIEQTYWEASFFPPLLQ